MIEHYKNQIQENIKLISVLLQSAQKENTAQLKDYAKEKRRNAKAS